MHFYVQLLTMLFVILAVGLVTFNFGSTVNTHYYNGSSTAHKVVAQVCTATGGATPSLRSHDIHDM